MSIDIYSVSRLNKQIKDILESNFYGIWIEGEISSLRYSSTGHLYFSLVDEESSIGVIIYKNRLKGLNFDIENGMNVVLFGSIGLYVRGGTYRIVAEHIRLSGTGKKFYDLEKLKKEFRDKGYFNNKKPIPKNPQNILLVTSVEGAAIRDILNILKRRSFGLNVYIYPVVVQGEYSEQSLLEALNNINLIKDNIDVVILTRGGGSNEDLWVFNSPSVSKALFEIKFPTISAIGHEIDYTLCDFVADKRAETPSAAAEIITTSKIQLREKLLNLQSITRNSINRIITRKNEKLGIYSISAYLLKLKSFLGNKLIYIDILNSRMFTNTNRKMQDYKIILQKFSGVIEKSSPKNRIESAKQKNKMLKYTIEQDMQTLISKKRQHIDIYSYTLPSLNPKNILKKGYTITTDTLGNPIKSILDVKNINKIKTIFMDGEIVSKIEKSEE